MTKVWTSLHHQSIDVYRVTYYNIFLEHDQLFYLVYEQMEVSKGSFMPHMWTFQSKITLENLTQKLQEKSLKDQHPILYEFLQSVSSHEPK